MPAGGPTLRSDVFPNRDGKLTTLAWLADAVSIAVALRIACALYPLPWSPRDTLAVAVAALLLVPIGQFRGLYRTAHAVPLRNELRNVWISWFTLLLLLVLVAFVTKSSAQYSRYVVGVWAGLAPLTMSLWRIALSMVLHSARKRGRNTRNVAIVGASPLGERLEQSFARSPWAASRVWGYYDDRGASRWELSPGAGKVRGDLDSLVTEARDAKIDVVYIALPPRAELRVNSIIQRLADTTASVYIAYGVGNSPLLRTEWSAVGDVPVMSVVEHPFHGIDGVTKRIEDVVVGSMIMGLIAVPMLLIAIGIKLTSRGPVFFRQRRYGLNGEEVRVLKFRTMRVMEDGNRIPQATPDDPRVTRFGRFLRRTSLDELPQFLQVLAGQMSIVGPRPHAVGHNEEYRQLIQGYMLRHKVKPGITGWAQVNGWRGQTDTLEKMEKRVECDLAYIRNWTLSTDLKIIALTVVGVLRRRNAY